MKFVIVNFYKLAVENQTLQLYFEHDATINFTEGNANSVSNDFQRIFIVLARLLYCYELSNKVKER